MEDSLWSNIKRKAKDFFGVKDELNEEELKQANQAIANIDWNKVSQNAPVLGQDTDKMNVQNAQEVADLTKEVNQRKIIDDPNKMARTGLSALEEFGKSMSKSAEKMQPDKLRLGNVAQAIEGPEYAKARRQALMDMINKG